MTYGSGGPGQFGISNFFRHRGPIAPEAFFANDSLAELRRGIGSDLPRRLGPEFAAELESLGDESSASAFAESLLSLASRLERSGRPEIAVLLYHSLSSDAFELSFRQRAGRQLDAMFGRGSAWRRAEHLGRHLAEEATDPAALLSMGLAGAAFRMTRLAVLSRLASTPSANFLTRGFGAQVLSGTLGLFLEAPAYTLTGRGLRQLVGESIDENPGALGRELAAGGLTLLGLRVFGGLAGLGLRRWAGGNSAGEAGLRLLLPQAAMFGGIVLSRHLEGALGLRERPTGGTWLTDSLATLVQFNVGGRVLQGATGEDFTAQERLLESRGALLSALNERPVVSRSMPNHREDYQPGAAWMSVGLLALLAQGCGGHPQVSAAIFDPISIMEGLGLLVPVALGAKRVYDRYFGNPHPSHEYFEKHRTSILEGLGGPPPNNEPLVGEEALIVERLRVHHNERLYRRISPEELQHVLTAKGSEKGGAFRSLPWLPGLSAGPRVFDVGVDKVSGEIVEILELTHPLPQTPLFDGPDSTQYFRIGHLIDLQQYADRQQKPLIAIPVGSGSPYRLAVPLHFRPGSGYIPHLEFAPPREAMLNENLLATGALSQWFAIPRTTENPTRPFLIENDGLGYLVIDADSARVPIVPNQWMKSVQSSGPKIGGESLQGNRLSHPLSTGDTIHLGNADLIFIAPRPGFPLALIRSKTSFRPILDVPQERSRMGRPEDEPFPTFDPEGFRGLPLERLVEYANLERFLIPTLRLPDLVFTQSDGNRIILSPRLKPGESIPFGSNPGLNGVYLHGAWNSHGPREPLESAPIEFYLRQDADGFLIEAANESDVAEGVILIHGAGSLAHLRMGEAMRLTDGDIIEFGPTSRRSRLQWFRDLDSKERLGP